MQSPIVRLMPDLSEMTGARPAARVKISSTRHERDCELCATIFSQMSSRETLGASAMRYSASRRWASVKTTRVQK